MYVCVRVLCVCVGGSLQGLMSIASYLYITENEKLVDTEACTMLKLACTATESCKNHPFNTHYAMHIYGPVNAHC